MSKQILLFISGVILGFALFFVFNLTTPSKITPSKPTLNTSTECGIVNPIRYCGSSTLRCSVNCNACGCDMPQCESLPQCVP